MVSKKILKQYAQVAIQVGVNVKKGQPLVINAPAEAYEFTRYLVEEAYLKGASFVKVRFNDLIVTRIGMKHAEEVELTEIPKYQTDEIEYDIGKGVCRLHVISEVPNNLKGIDPIKVGNVTKAYGKVFQKYAYYSMNDIGAWSIVAFPNKTWAELVFPKLKGDKAVKALWKAILKASRIEGDNPVENWANHNKEIKKYATKMNKYDFKELHFKNSLGTDIVVGLVENHIWKGGSATAENGQEFNPNIPTEEVFTMPDRLRVDGVVVNTKPLSYQGSVIDGFKLEFKDGKVVSHSAKKGAAALNNLLNADEGARHIGEIALISHDSPISNLNLLFYNTLFDENASCHMALGRCYPTNIENGTKMSEQELLEAHGNANSMVHVDFMFGSVDMSITGIKKDGKKVKVFENGNFVI